MIQRVEAQRLSSRNEWSVVSSSLPPALETLTVSRLKSKIVRAREFRQKYQDLYRRQKLSSKSRVTGAPGEKLNVRTKRKRQMFDEAMVRFRLQLGKLSKPPDTSALTRHRRGAKTEAPRVHSRAARQQADRHRQSLGDRAASPALPKRAKQKAMGQKRRHSHVAAVTRRQQSKRDSSR